MWEESTSVRPPHLSPPCVCPEASCVVLVLLRAPAPRFSIQKRTKNARHSSTVGSDVARIPSSEVAVITGKIVSQSVSQSFYFDFLPHKSFAYSISLFTRLDINIASVATATTNIKEEETERNWFKRLKKCVLWCRCVCDIAKLSHFEIILISHKLLCENNFGFFPRWPLSLSFCVLSILFCVEKPFHPKFFFLSAMLPLSEPPL